MTVLEYLKLNDVGEILLKLIKTPFIKVISSIVTAIVTFGFDVAHNKAFLAVFLLILIDCLTAILASFKTGVMIRSSRFFRTPVKLGIYFGLIYISRITEFAVPVLSGVLDETMIGFTAATELISILENVHKMGFTVPNQLIKKLINIRDSK